MRNLLSALILVLFLAACKSDTATVTENQNGTSATANDKTTSVTTKQNTQPQTAQPQTQSKSTEAPQTTKELVQSAEKSPVTVKVKQPTSNSGNLTVAKPVVKNEVHNNSMSVTMHKAPEKVMDNFPFDVDLKTADGKIVNSSDVLKKNGKPTVLLFWLTTCRPCHMKMDAIKPLYPEWKEEADFNVVAISGDFPQNYPKFVKQVNQKGWEWDTYNDVNRGFRDILPGGLNGYPQTFIFDKNGNLVYQDKKFKSGDELALFEQIKKASST